MVKNIKNKKYADDTSLISDGSPLSIDGNEGELDFFVNIFSLKLIFDKQKWCGLAKNS